MEGGRWPGAFILHTGSGTKGSGASVRVAGQVMRRRDTRPVSWLAAGTVSLYRYAPCRIQCWICLARGALRNRINLAEACVPLEQKEEAYPLRKPRRSKGRPEVCVTGATTRFHYLLWRAAPPSESSLTG